MSKTSKSPDERKTHWLGDRLEQALTEKSARGIRTYKTVILITVATLAMAVLIYVNLQNVRDTGRRGGSLLSDTRTPESAQQSSEPDRITRVEP